ncbi:ATP-binding component of an ABC superfamily dipeptide transporter [Rahnella aquatilis CIP 78.65 = ATCC 33071]|uniref:Glutathione import ATP-binding protein GsiA n=1 Tax=Rahnella aquatilis (strain ATCC 33071 / DSM 4594 / JCM 1683 / NBRC 105701 / NCIMB 13365 / CIP 78.65) TaxID=745277 RepID=H2J1F4_RAHAC|nr:ABC transporter ATP-binding protein [Rahnella aquatilis]AEX54401.1 ATPase component of various ABC-type transport systems with duplicated ATPase domain [Rahnella aquatilis CIP 78.65 = ATCC 33071]KFC99837.1 ATP-binding component of an ABC superfamily dipeptide transporter [Rahnella aquatilis CIP 78.65 = ATCC 33071]
MQTPVLQVDKLNTAFSVDGEWLNVVRDLSFSIGPKETLALVGESGSGKSVTAMSVMRLLDEKQTRYSGRIHFDGRELLSLTPPEMQSIRGNRIGMIFQEPMTSLNPVLKIGVQITEVLKRHRGMDDASARAEAVRLLEKVRIPAATSRLNEYPLSFSGGMRQRVVIAIALACNPRLLIADEPTTALDVTIQAQILALIKSLQEEEGMSVLFITHDMGVVAEVADRTLVLHRGEAVEQATTREIFHHPKHPYTRALLSAVPRLGTMQGVALPKRFPLTDMHTGEPLPVAESVDTLRTGQPVLEIKNLVTRFDVKSGLLRRVSARIHAVEDVSFSLQPGETLSLVGESGCGKSTTGRTILRLTEATSGDILIRGQDIRRADSARLADIRTQAQMIFQDPYESLNPRMRIGQAIAEPMISLGLHDATSAKIRVAQLLEQVGLQSNMAMRFPHQFSGGQRQRICIARALALEPKMIIADEAVSALDVSVKAQVINLMLDLQQELGLAYLFISHDMAVVERISHRVAVMYQGEIVEIGSRADIFENPQHIYTRKLLAAVPVPDPDVHHTRTVVPEELASPLRAATYQPPVRHYREVSAGHFVQI